MTDVLAHPHTVDAIAFNAWSTDTNQFTVNYEHTGLLRVGKRDRTTGVVTSAQVTGAASTALNLPVDNDDHNWCCCWVDGLGHMWVAANMHNQPWRCIRSTVPVDNTDSIVGVGFAAQPNLPGNDARYTYPRPARLPNGTIWLYVRSSIVGNATNGFSSSGRCDSHFWTLGPTATTWSAKTKILRGVDIPGGGSGLLVDDYTNYSAYADPIVDSNGRLHMFWIWRAHSTDAAGRTNTLPSYAYSDNGTTWKAMNGTTLTLPIDPTNNLACQTGITHPTGFTETVYLNGGGICVDGNGYPHYIVSTLPWCHIYWNGSAWQQEVIPATGVNTLAGISMNGPAVPYWIRGALWLLVATATPYRRFVLIKADGTTYVPMSGPIYDPALPVPPGGNWTSGVGGSSVCADPEAYRRLGTVEVNSPDGNLPKIWQFGRGGRVFDEGDGPEDPDPGGPVYTIPSSFDATGATDVSAALQAWLITLPFGIQLQFPEGGVYRVDNGLRFRRRQDTRYFSPGAGCQFIVGTTGDRNRSNLWFDLCIDIQVDNLHVKGANPNGGNHATGYNDNLEGQHGFKIGACQGALIENCSATETYGDGVWIGGDIATYPEFPAGSTDITVRNFRGTNIGRTGFVCVWGEDITIEDSSLTNGSRTGIDFEPVGDNAYVDGVLVQRCTFHNFKLNWIAAQGRERVDNVTLLDNVLTGDSALKIKVNNLGQDMAQTERCANWRIERNTGSGYPGTGYRAVMQLWRVDGVVVKDNVQNCQASRDMHMVQALGCTAITVTGNTGINLAGQYHTDP